MRTFAKRALGRLPLAAEIFQSTFGRGRTPVHGYRLDRLQRELPAWVAAARTARLLVPGVGRRRALVFAYLPWWLEYATALSLVLWAEGNEVDLAYLPYRNWTRDIGPFDLRRQRVILDSALRLLPASILRHDLSQVRRTPLPAQLIESLEAQNRVDVQYTLLREDVEYRTDGVEAGLLALRRERNYRAASGLLTLAADRPYDVVVVPNGSILEFGAVYRAARQLGIRTTTFEFGEQRGRMWLAQNSEVMQQDTRELWSARGRAALRPAETRSLRELIQARRGGRPWGLFSRRWQSSGRRGAAAVRAQLGLDRKRPVVLLCTNVVGDSLALGRQVFTRGMEDWLTETVRRFAADPGVQLVIRVHPGEMVAVGQPSVGIVRSALGEVPGHIVLVPPDSPLNTYDLMPLARLGLVYTSTVGLEMAMMGIPVVVAGQTHYRGKGFTWDPTTRRAYHEIVGKLIRGRKVRLARPKIARAWRYAYRFFFEYPFPIPWHLVGFWEDQAREPVTRVVGAPARSQYRRTLDALMGHRIPWKVAA
ncbi:MAG: hypothetical protein WD906_07910 [Anaerolineales bacterium]